MLASYFAISLLLILRLFDTLLQRAVAAMPCINRIRKSRPSVFDPYRLLAGLFRLAILFGLGLPYVMATVLTYRPKVDLRDDPKSQLGFNFEDVSFHAIDGTVLSGWWIPAEQRQGRRRPGSGIGTRRC